MTEQRIYFHGIPGSAGELGLFGHDWALRLNAVHVVDRFSTSAEAGVNGYFQNLAESIRVRFPDQPLRLIGFSLGASAALRTAPYLAAQITGIDLISAAAPLGLGDYLGTMAGAPVFKLAQSSRVLFALAARLQSGLATVAPGRLYDALFASARAGDLALCKNPTFKAAMLPILQQSLGSDLHIYRREILAYAQDWVAELDQVDQPVTLYHGRADNWSPVAMAQDLAERLPNIAAVHVFDGHSHYSSLREYWQRYFTQPSPIVS